MLFHGAGQGKEPQAPRFPKSESPPVVQSSFRVKISLLASVPGIRGLHLAGSAPWRRSETEKGGMVMARSALTAAVFMGLILASEVMAVPVGKSVEWDTPMGKVIFDGKVHFDKGVKCTEC